MNKESLLKHLTKGIDIIRKKINHFPIINFSKIKQTQKYFKDFRGFPLYKKSFSITLIFLFIISLFILFEIEIRPTLINGIEFSQTLYLLSAIVQSLAAIAALVFTISLVVAQISSRYSLHVLKGFFDKYTVGYIILFIISILLLFWQLADTNTKLVKLSLIFATACVIFLFPFFLFIREKLDPVFQINEMAKEALKNFLLVKRKCPLKSILLKMLFIAP